MLFRFLTSAFDPTINRVVSRVVQSFVNGNNVDDIDPVSLENRPTDILSALHILDHFEPDVAIVDISKPGNPMAQAIIGRNIPLIALVEYQQAVVCEESYALWVIDFKSECFLTELQNAIREAMCLIKSQLCVAEGLATDKFGHVVGAI